MKKRGKMVLFAISCSPIGKIGHGKCVQYGVWGYSQELA